MSRKYRVHFNDGKEAAEHDADEVVINALGAYLWVSPDRVADSTLVAYYPSHRISAVLEVKE